MEKLNVNPYRYRARIKDKLILGRPGKFPLRDYTQADASLLGATRLTRAEHPSLEPTHKTWLEDNNFLVAWEAGNGRYSRQIGFFSLWPGSPLDKQDLLRRSTVAVLGLGGVGAQVAYLMAAAGVGKLILCDFDAVEESNLNRQLLYHTDDIGKSKVWVAAERLRQRNPEVAISAFEQQLLEPSDVEGIAKGADFVVRAVDTPANILWLVDQACRKLGIPHIGGGFVEELAVVGPLLYPDDPPVPTLVLPERATHFKQATFAPMAFWVASYIAGDILRCLANLGDPWLRGRVLQLNGITGAVNTLEVTNSGRV